jgi:hypothetical protein
MGEVRLRGTLRKFERLLSLVAYQRGITAGFSATARWRNDTRADREDQQQGEHGLHGNLRWVGKLFGV